MRWGFGGRIRGWGRGGGREGRGEDVREGAARDAGSAVEPRVGFAVDRRGRVGVEGNAPGEHTGL